jgi:hypothetical protein
MIGAMEACYTSFGEPQRSLQDGTEKERAGTWQGREPSHDGLSIVPAKRGLVSDLESHMALRVIRKSGLSGSAVRKWRGKSTAPRGGRENRSNERIG